MIRLNAKTLATSWMFPKRFHHSISFANDPYTLYRLLNTRRLCTKYKIEQDHFSSHLISVVLRLNVVK